MPTFNAPGSKLLLLADDHSAAIQALLWPHGAERLAGKGQDARAPRQLRPAPWPTEKAASGAAKILIVDDDVTALRVLQNALKNLGEFFFARSGGEALAVARGVRPDLILLDACMPDIDGFTVCRTLKADPDFKSTPIVFVSGFTDVRSERRALDTGAADFVAKPCTPAVLRSRVNNLLQQKRSADADRDGDRVRLDAESRARAAAESASRISARMLAHVSQEMGSALRSLLGHASLMAGDRSQPLPEDQSRRLARVIADGQRLDRLLGDVLDFERLGAEPLAIQLQEVDAAHCAVQAAAAVAALSVQTGVTMSVVTDEGLGPVIADAQRLTQCLVSLLRNAVGYNRPGGWAELRLGRSGEQLAMSVSDGGLGMDAEQLAQLFEPFNRLGRQVTTVAGAGLALAITRRLVEAMGGTLHVASRAGEGSTFTLLLPTLGGFKLDPPALHPLEPGIIGRNDKK